MPQIESFFKYLSSDTAIIVLENLSFKYSSTLDFNDPFDYNPALSNIGLSKFIKRVAKNNNITIPKKKASQNYKLLVSDEFRREASNGFSVTCFSKSPHIVPMWAHYADCHKGCVLGFSDASIEELESMMKTSEWKINMDTDYLVPYDVKYSNVRPTLFDSEGITNAPQNGFDSCLIKAKAWEYEQEVRVIKMKPPGIHPFNISQLRSIRFGLNIDPSVRINLIRIVNELKKKHRLNIRLFNVNLDHREFKFNDIKCN